MYWVIYLGFKPITLKKYIFEVYGLKNLMKSGKVVVIFTLQYRYSILLSEFFFYFVLSNLTSFSHIFFLIQVIIKFI